MDVWNLAWIIDAHGWMVNGMNLVVDHWLELITLVFCCIMEGRNEHHGNGLEKSDHGLDEKTSENHITITASMNPLSSYLLHVPST
jgi:hypothetical protein